MFDAGGGQWGPALTVGTVPVACRTAPPGTLLMTTQVQEGRMYIGLGTLLLIIIIVILVL